MKPPFLSILYISLLLFAVAPSTYGQDIPFSTDDTNLTVWNGTEYLPFFINGTNLGVAVPGTFPGELAASREQYSSWFAGIKDAGFNCIRIYTLHYPRFYEMLNIFNTANPQNPLLFIQGVWLNEELPGYHDDLYFMTDTFRQEIEENVDCLHGNRFIPVRRGKAFGDYATDASKWCLAYIIGREVHPAEVITTNANNLEYTEYAGKHFSISNTFASEVWFTSQLDYLVDFENKNYNTMRPISASSWPTLDPLSHPEEINRDEDAVSLNLSKVVLEDAPAGMFISYHAYPYYPDFVSQQSDYLDFHDSYGTNSYKGYLSDLKSHYQGFPLVIAEYGVPSSWGIAHYSTSGMNHGGFDETEQGNTNIRMLNTIEDTNCGGGIQFAWIDEWFKRTWITDAIDAVGENRILWHNITAAEQNFGLLSFKKETELQSLKEFDTDAPIPELKADGNYTFFELEIALKAPMDVLDEMWIALDTYADDLGESRLPNGDTIPYRSEYVLHLTKHSANLYVTEAYDIYGLFHQISGSKQLYHSIATDNAPWNIVRWKNNNGLSDVQYVGSLQVNYDFQNPSSKDAVTISDDKIHIELPWSYLNVVAPNQLRVLHDYRNTYATEDTITDGFNISVAYKDKWYTTDERFIWSGWDVIDNTKIIETQKMSYITTKAQSAQFNMSAIAVRDSFVFEKESYPVGIDSINGLLKNDFDLDGEIMVALIAEHPQNGQVDLNNDGSFTYSPKSNYEGFDSMKYYVYDGHTLSEPNVVVFNIIGNREYIDGEFIHDNFMLVSPNPVSSLVTIQANIVFEELLLFDALGKTVHSFNYGERLYKLDMSKFASGMYMFVGRYDGRYYSQKIMKKG